MSTLPFFVADTLGMTLYQKESILFGEETRTFKVGAFDLRLKVEAYSDLVNPKEVGMWLSFSPRLWFYLIVRAKEQMLLAFDAKEAGITPKNRGSFGGLTVMETVKQLRKAIKAAFFFKDERWVKVDIKEVIGA